MHASALSASYCFSVVFVPFQFHNDSILHFSTLNDVEQYGYDGNDKQYVNDPSRTIGEKTNCPTYYEYYSNQIEYISHGVFLFTFNVNERQKSFSHNFQEMISFGGRHDSDQF